MRFASHRRAAMTAVALVAVACDEPFHFDGTLQLPVAAVLVRPDTATVVAGAGLQLTAVLLDSTGDTITDRQASWSSLDLARAAVSFSGFVQTLAPGAARVVAEAQGRRDTARIGILPVTFAAVAAGGRHSCGHANSQRLYCWGLGLAGQLGVGGTPFLHTAPVAVASFSPYAAVAAGASHSCAIGRFGPAECWGLNSSSQLGRGSAGTDPTRPELVATSVVVTALALGSQHSCALLPDSTAVCWGGNIEGQIGDSQGVTRPAPTAVVGGHRFLRIEAGAFHNCALDPSGAAWCWGANTAGQLGDSTAGGNRRYPVAVRGALAFTTVTAGGTHSCGSLADGRVFCWGDNGRGQIGSGLPDPRALTPVQVAGGLYADAVTAGAHHSCALTPSGAAWCWGANDRGQLGDSTLVDRALPVATAGGLQFTSLAAGDEHTCGVVRDGTAYCWGANESGQLGDATVNDRGYPWPVVSPTPLAAARRSAAAHPPVITP